MDTQPTPRPSLHGRVVKALNISRRLWPKIAAESGVSIRTIEKIADFTIESPRVDKIEKLAGYFRLRHTF